LQYTRGAFKAAIQQKAQQMKRWIIRRQKRFVYATVATLLLVGAYHLQGMLIFKKVVETKDLNSPIELLRAQVLNDELVATTPRQKWVAMPKIDRQKKAQQLMVKVHDKGWRGMQVLDEKSSPLVITMYQGKQAALSFVRLPEDDPSKD